MITLDINTAAIRKLRRRAYVRRELMALGRIAKMLLGAAFIGWSINLLFQAVWLFI